MTNQSIFFLARPLSILLALVLFVLPAVAAAQTLSAEQQSDISAYRSVQSVVVPSISVPSAVSVPLESQQFINPDYLVLENETGTFIGSTFITTVTVEDLVRSAAVVPAVTNPRALVDNDRDTSVDFDVIGDTANTVTITLLSDGVTPITASRLDLALAPHVSLPLTVAIRADVDGTLKQVVTETQMRRSSINFPETVANRFEITFRYIQPLRISELNLSPDRALVESTGELRFLAQPNRTYQIFSDADRTVRPDTTESGNLRANDGVVTADSSELTDNLSYLPADIDEDGIADTLDNCVSTANPDQLDIDANGKGDSCEDFDRDGRLNPVDNCPNTPNRNQADEDSDGIGDVCDEEESRVTEQYPWVPWVGMGAAVIVIIALFALVGRQVRENELEEEEAENEET